jgi:Ca-activated chloride channel family protein
MTDATDRKSQSLAACLALAVMLAVAVIAQGLERTLTFESPADGDYVSGATLVRVRLNGPGPAPASVTLFADGALLCTLNRLPFECQWDAGLHVVEHALRATAVFADGGRVTGSIRTKGVAYAESVDVDAVQVTASVTDDGGRFAKGLRREDFRIFEDGVRQEISSFVSENVPLELMVAVDMSGSMKPAMPRVKESVKRFLTALRPADRVTILGFNDSVYTLMRPSADLAARLKAIDRLAPWGGTSLYDVIVQGIDQLGRQTGRRAMVVFTDGEDLNSRVPIAVAERRLEASDVVLYPMGMGRAPQLMNLREVLGRLAKKSGGRAFFGDRAEKLDGAFTEILDELSNQYLLGYTPTDARRDGRWRKLSVEVANKDLRVRARLGYRADPR